LRNSKTQNTLGWIIKKRGHINRTKNITYKRDVMRLASSTGRKQEILTKFNRKILWEDTLGDVGVDNRILLTYSLQKQVVNMLSGLNWLGTMANFSDDNDEHLSSVNENFSIGYISINLLVNYYFAN
jgi:hypothetical protein